MSTKIKLNYLLGFVVFLFIMILHLYYKFSYEIILTTILLVIRNTGTYV